jgi:hypothetical protein
MQEKRLRMATTAPLRLAITTIPTSWAPIALASAKVQGSAF